MPFTKNIHNFFQGLPNPGFRSVKVQTETFYKKDSLNLKKIKPRESFLKKVSVCTLTDLNLGFGSEKMMISYS